jgi:hypothetical protein
MTFTEGNHKEWQVLYNSSPIAVRTEMRRFIDDLHDALTGKLKTQKVYFIQKGWRPIFDRFEELSRMADTMMILKLQEELDKVSR